MEDSSPLQSLALNPSQTACSFPTHCRRPLRSRTYDSLIRILSHCRHQLRMQGPVSDEDGGITCNQVLTAKVLVSSNSKGSEDKIVGETSDGETKEKTYFQDPDSKQATPTKLHQPELVRDSELEVIPSSQISIEDYLVVEEQVNDCAVQSTKQLENVYSVQMSDFDALKDVGMDQDPSFLQLNEILNFNFGSDMVVESSEVTQLTQEEDTVLVENEPKDVEHELQAKEMELAKLIYSSGTTEVSSCQISGEIEEGEISGDAMDADESFDALTEGASLGEETTENLHDSKGYFDRNDLLFEDKDRGRQQHGMPDLSLVNTVNIESNSKKVESRTLTEQLAEYSSKDIPRSVMETPKSNDTNNCSDNLTLPEGNHQENAAGNQNSMSIEKDEDAGKNKRKRGMTKERRAKKKKKERLKRAEKNRELGVKRLKLPTIVKPKKIVHCRHYLQGRCHEGEKCKFSHDTVPLTKSKPCGHFARHACMKGDHCPYDHQLSKYPCNNYSLNGFCNRGSECLFSHEIAAKSLSATPSLPKHDFTSLHQTAPEKQGSHPISEINKSELKSPSPVNNSNCSRPMDSCGRSLPKVDSRLCSVANSPAQRELLALKPVPRTGGQAPRGVSFLQSGAAPLGGTNKDKRDESSAKRTDSVGAGYSETVNVPGGINVLNGMSEVVALTPTKPQGINFLSFGQPPSDDSSNKILSTLLSNYNDGMGKSAGDGMVKGKLTCSLAQGAGTSNANRQLIGSAINLVSDMTEKANGTPLTVPQNVKFLSFNRSQLDVSTSKENANLDSAEGDTALSLVKGRENLQDISGTPSPSFCGPSHQSTGGWTANSSSSFKTSLFSNTSGLVRKAVISTLAFAAQLEPDIKVGSSHHQQRS